MAYPSLPVTGTGVTYDGNGMLPVTGKDKGYLNS